MLVANSLHVLLITAALLCLCFFPGAKAFADTSNSLEDIDINGLILDGTITFSGHAFYREFAKIWQQDPLARRYNLVVLERPSARQGNQLIIEYQHQVLFSSVISARQNRFDRLSQNAAYRVQQQLKDMSVRSLFSTSPDISDDEF